MQNKAIPSKTQLVALADELFVELGRILEYWMLRTIDEQHGGFYGKIDHFNQIVTSAGKGAVLNARILWSFAAAFHATKNKLYLEMADRAYDYLRQYFVDHDNGGLIWEVDNTGKPLSTRKQTYAQGFGIYGFSEYHKVTGNQECLELAQNLFQVVETHCFDRQFGGYVEALASDWSALEDMRLSAKDANYPKSMNTHLHILESYTNLYRVWKNDQLAEQIHKLIRVFLDHILDPGSGHFHLFFESDWTVKSDTISYGHDIEGAWLLTEAAEVLDDPELLQEVKEVAVQMSEAVLNEGCAVDGSVYYEMEKGSNRLDAERHWWVQAEAMVGFLNAFEISRRPQYLTKAIDAWQFIKSNLLDFEHGEWYWSVDNSGNPDTSQDKVGFWKCPYHNSRACMESMRRLKSIVQLWK